MSDKPEGLFGALFRLPGRLIAVVIFVSIAVVAAIVLVVFSIAEDGSRISLGFTEISFTKKSAPGSKVRETQQQLILAASETSFSTRVLSQCVAYQFTQRAYNIDEIFILSSGNWYDRRYEEPIVFVPESTIDIENSDAEGSNENVLQQDDTADEEGTVFYVEVEPAKPSEDASLAGLLESLRLECDAERRAGS